MINKDLITLTKKLKNNPKYLENIKNFKTSQELYEYCSSISGGYSKEEFDRFIQNIAGINKKLKLLSDDKLESVSGGLDRKQAKDLKGKLEKAAMGAATLSTLTKVGEMIYFDDIEKMSFDEMAYFFDDIMSNVGFG